MPPKPYCALCLAGAGHSKCIPFYSKRGELMLTGKPPSHQVVPAHATVRLISDSGTPVFAPDNHKSHMINCNPVVAAGAMRALQAFIHTFVAHQHQNPGGLSPELNSDTPFFEFHTAPLTQTL